MNDRPVSVVLAALKSVTGRKPIRNSFGWKARCPAHDDKRPSLTVSEGDDGRALVHCHAGCPVEVIAKALGLTMRDLMPVRVSPSPRPAPRRDSAGKGDGGRQKTFKTAAEAVAELERRYGRWAARWVYQDAKGEPVGVVVRWDRPGGRKDIRPVSRTPAGWIIGGMPTPRPLYQLPTLADARRVYVCEGEKAADAVISLGLIATTSPHGSQAAKSADWSALAAKQVVILPDNDKPGEKYAADMVAELAKLTPAPTVKVLHLDKLPRGGDAFDFVESYRNVGALNDDEIRAHLERWADRISPVELDTPAPAREPYRLFPVDVLPEPVRSFVATAAQAIGCDPSYVALPLLAALAAAIGNTRRIQLKRGWSEPPIVWAVIVGESGTLKTPAFRLVLRPLRDLQAKALKAHAAAVEGFEVELLRYDKELSAWKHSKEDGDQPTKPQPPPAVRFVVSDTTVEALAPVLLVNPRGVLLARDEIGGWFGSFDRYASGKAGADEAHWLSMHGGENIIVDRKTGTPRTIYIPSASVSVTGGIQPRILDRALGAKHRESGLLARLLLAMPPRRPKHWTEADITPLAEAALLGVFERLHELDFARDADGEPQPVALSMMPAAKALWITFYNEHAKEQADLSGDLSAAWSKLEGYVARLALAVHCVRWAAQDPALSDADKVDEISVAAGIALSRWFGGEARRVYGILAEDDETRERRRLVEWIERRGGGVTVRNLTHGLHQYRGRADAAKAELDALAKAGFGSWTHPAPGPKGGRPSPRFVLNSATPVTKTPADDDRNGGFGCGDAGDAPAETATGDAPDADSGAAPGKDDDWGEV